MGTLQHVVVQQVSQSTFRKIQIAPDVLVHATYRRLRASITKQLSLKLQGLGFRLSRLLDFFTFRFLVTFRFFMTFRDLFRLFGTFRLFVFLVTFRLFVQLQMSKGRTLERKAAACAPDGKQAAVALERRMPLPHRRRQAAGGLLACFGLGA